MVTASGVKLLDFGLAKLREIEGAETLERSTKSLPLTRAGHRARHDPVYGAGAGRRTRRGRAHGHLCARRDSLRDDHRPPAVRGTQPGERAGVNPDARSAAAVVAAAGRSRQCRPRREEVPRQGSRRALAECGGPERRACSGAGKTAHRRTARLTRSTNADTSAAASSPRSWWWRRSLRRRCGFSPAASRPAPAPRRRSSFRSRSGLEPSPPPGSPRTEKPSSTVPRGAATTTRCS